MQAQILQPIAFVTIVRKILLQASIPVEHCVVSKTCPYDNHIILGHFCDRSHRATLSIVVLGTSFWKKCSPDGYHTAAETRKSSLELSQINCNTMEPVQPPMGQFLQSRRQSRPTDSTDLSRATQHESPRKASANSIVSCSAKLIVLLYQYC